MPTNLAYVFAHSGNGEPQLVAVDGEVALLDQAVADG
jgi:hypothetical protein